MSSIAFENYCAEIKNPDVENFGSILTNLDGEIESGKVIGILGPSGCGKTTLVRVVSGVFDMLPGSVSSGSISILGMKPQDLQKDGEISTAFQEPTLLPWKNVLDNVLFPLSCIGEVKKNDVLRAEELLNKLGLVDYRNYMPNQLSGGMKQRVAFARCVISDARFLVFDEPLSAVDQIQRENILSDLGAYIRKRTHSSSNNKTRATVWVSHSVEELAFMSDIILVMSKRPGHFKRKLKSPLGKTRNKGVFRDPEFFEFCNLIRQAA